MSPITISQYRRYIRDPATPSTNATHKAVDWNSDRRNAYLFETIAAFSRAACLSEFEQPREIDYDTK